MTGMDHGIIGQGIHHLAYTVSKYPEIATRQVCSPNAFPEKHISGYDETLRPGVKTHTAGRMAGYEDHFKEVIADMNGFAGFQEFRFTLVIVEGKVPHQTACRSQLEHLFLKGVDLKGQPIGLGNVLVTENMVQMAVGIQEHDRFQAIA